MTFFYGPEADMFTFFKIPKLLFAEPYKRISTDAKLLYGLMLDRMSLSARDERWMDEDGRVYIYFPITEAMETLDIAEHKAVKLYRELENVELIQRKRQGLGKPSKIYVSKFFKVSPEAQKAEATAAESLNCEKRSSRIAEIAIQETSKTQVPPLIETEESETESNYSMMNPPKEAKTPKRKSPEPVLEGVEQMEAQVRTQIAYSVLCARRHWDIPAIDGLVSLIADVCTSRKPSYRINGELRKGDEVRRRFQRLQCEDIEAVLEAVYNDSTDRRIKNMRSYLITALYNAQGTSQQYMEHNENLPGKGAYL